jgi:hypothetical protein
MSKKGDDYGNTYSYFQVDNDASIATLDKFFKKSTADIKKPYFIGEDGKYVMRIKDKYITQGDLKQNKVYNDTLINMKPFSFVKEDKEIKGYYISDVGINPVYLI